MQYDKILNSSDEIMVMLLKTLNHSLFSYLHYNQFNIKLYIYNSKI
jgi:hypothetical protein